MKKMLSFASRNVKELVRDPLNLAFSIGFPTALLLLFAAIQANIPIPLYEMISLSPGIAVFGLSFITLFSATLISKDRSTSFLMRLFASPLTSTDFILGYTFPLLPMGIMQSAVCFGVAVLLGMTWSVNILLTMLVLIPTAIMFVGIGLLAGSVLNDKQVGGICGALLTNLSAWLSGAWFDLNLVGGAFKTIAYGLPFAHAVDAARASMAGNYQEIMPHLWVVIGYAVVIMILAILAFRKKMSSKNN
jgi:ABC-2 type transport system permease protein